MADYSPFGSLAPMAPPDREAMGSIYGARDGLAQMQFPSWYQSSFGALSPSPFPDAPPSRQDAAFDKSIDRWKQLAKDVFFAPSDALKAFNEKPTFSNALGIMPMGGIGKVPGGNWGYGGTWYHGTNAPNFSVFNPKLGGLASGSVHENPAIFMTNDAGLAGSYASAGKNPMAQPFTWGEYHQQIEKPLIAELQKLKDPASRLFGNRAGADSVINKQLDLDGLLQEGLATPEQIDRLKSFIARSEGRDVASMTAEGARVMPLVARGNYSEIGMFPGFNDVYWDAAMRHAKKGGFSGVHFKDVVDSPTGTGPAADVLAVFEPKNIRSKFANFNPIFDRSGYLLGSLAGGAALTGWPESVTSGSR
jgi:hypothetical protein